MVGGWRWWCLARVKLGEYVLPPQYALGEKREFPCISFRVSAVQAEDLTAAQANAEDRDTAGQAALHVMKYSSPRQVKTMYFCPSFGLFSSTTSSFLCFLRPFFCVSSKSLLHALFCASAKSAFCLVRKSASSHGHVLRMFKLPLLAAPHQAFLIR